MKRVLLNLSHVGLELPGLKRPILKDINYTVYQNDFIILLGHNGSGKSSLLKVLSRSYFPTHGAVFLQGKALKDYHQQDLAENIITIAQDYQASLFPSLTVLENCILVKQKHKKNILCMDMVNEKDFFIKYLSDFNQHFIGKLATPVASLSGGEQQTLILALSILYPPKILLLDEHTSALDPHAAAKLMAVTSKVIHQYNITCILSTHNLDLALNYGNRVLALAHGEIAQCIEPLQKQGLTARDLLKICY